VLHFILPLVLVAMSLLHLILLHEKGSTNPLGVCSKLDIISFYPYFVIKDIFGFVVVVSPILL